MSIRQFFQPAARLVLFFALGILTFGTVFAAPPDLTAPGVIAGIDRSATYNLVTNDEVLSVNEDPLVKQGYRVANKTKEWEIWAKDLADGSKAVALFNISDKDQVIGVSKSQIGLTGIVRDLWRQKDVGPMGDTFSTMVSPHGVAFVKIKP